MVRFFSRFISKICSIRLLNEENTDNITLSLETLVLSLMFVFYIISGPLLKKFNVKIIRPSGLIMILGLLITLISYKINPNSNFFKSFEFQNSLFFTFVLPIVIFSSAYITKIEAILKYFRYILLFSIPGTIITFIIISSVTYYLNSRKFFSTRISSDKGDIIFIETVNLSLLEILQFSAAISACDSVISLSFIMEDNEPKLNAISLGDSILNNAVAISIFNSLTEISNKDNFNLFGLSLKILIKSCIIFVFSLIIGIAVGIFHSLFLIYMKKFHLNRVQEISTILLFAFISYILCDNLYLSPMTALLACGLCMSHYTFYNLNYQTKEESVLNSLSLNVLAEAMIFSLLGMNIIFYSLQSFSFSLLITELILIVICRIFTIFGLINILVTLGVSPELFRLQPKYKFILSNIGSIRGVISFALSLLIVTPNNENKVLLVGCTIYIVFLTDLICILISPLFKRKEREIYNKEIISINTSDDKAMKHDIFTFIHPNTEIYEENSYRLKSEEKLQKEETSLIYNFIQYDNKCILPKIVLNWPEVKEDNNIISRRIKKQLGLWAEEKEKNLSYKENDTIKFNIPGLFENYDNHSDISDKKINFENRNKIGLSNDDSLKEKIELKEI